MVKNKTAIQRIIILSIRGYQKWISPLMGPKCRFYPSCSSYTIESVIKFGSLKGLWLAMKRILKCHPLHQGGYDPVPQQKK